MKKQFEVSLSGTSYPAFYIDNPIEAKEFIDKMMTLDVCFGIDTETAALPKYKGYSDAALNPYYSEIRLLQVFTGKASVVFDLLKINRNSLFIPFLSTKRFVAHNAVFDLQFFRRMGVRDMQLGCSMIMAKLLFHAKLPEDDKTSASLSALTELLLGESILKTVQTSDWSEPELTFEQIEYAALDAVCTLKIAENLIKGLVKHGLERIYKLYRDAQHPIVEMQLNGIRLNEKAHEALIEDWRVDLYRSRREVLAITKLDTITSHKIAEWLEDNLDTNTLVIWPRSDTGKLKTDAHTLSEFSYLPLVKPFSEFQKVEKLISSFGTKLLNQVNSETHRIHSRYILCGARTGRLACTNPNFQQSPRNSKFRSNFVTSTKTSFICADYNQIELRVAAEVSRDKNMLQAYRDGKDLHELTASTIIGSSYHSFSKEEKKAARQMAKAVNFGFLFGLGYKKFSKYAKQSYGVEVTDSESKNSINTWRQLYATYHDWQIGQATEAAKTLLCRTPCGKLRCLDRENTYGPSMNTPVQGGAGEVLLHALIRLHKSKKLHGVLVGTVHDEIIVETDDECAEIDKETVNECMVQGFLDVFPNGITNKLVEAHIGKSWYEAK